MYKCAATKQKTMFKIMMKQLREENQNELRKFIVSYVICKCPIWMLDSTVRYINEIETNKKYIRKIKMTIFLWIDNKLFSLQNQLNKKKQFRTIQIIQLIFYSYASKKDGKNFHTHINININVKSVIPLKNTQM